MTTRRAQRACVALAFALLAHAAAAADFALDVDLDPAARRLKASAELVAPGPYTFALRRELAVTAVNVDGRPAAVTRGARGEWRIAARKGAKLRIDYAGTLPALESLDHRQVLRDATPMVSVRGSFLPAGSGWYPEPGRAFSYTVRVRVPGAQRALVAGTLVRETVAAAGEPYLAEFSFAHPAEGIDLMAGPYVVREREMARPGAPPLRLRTYFPADIDALAEGYLDDSARYIALYSDAIGAYPFDAFSIVASPLPTGFGMPTLTYLGAEVLKLPFIRATSLGHEVLHNWWGSGVRVDYAHGNWSEGLTTFMADYFYRERESPKAARDMRMGWLRDFAAVPEGAEVALADFRSRTHGAEAAVGYGKAAMVFLMMRDEIGEAAFQKALRAFFAEHKYGSAGWNDLKVAFERASVRNLGAFFEQWLERRGGPRIAIRDARTRAPNAATLNLTQTVPAYALSVPVEVAGGGTSAVRRVRMEHARQTVTLDVPFAPERARIDPDLRLWRRLEPSELSPILRQWILAAHPRVSIVSPAAADAARTVAAAFFENAPRVVPLEGASASREPQLIVGLKPEVDAALARLRVTRPPQVDGGSAEAWTVAARADLPPLAVLCANDVEALRATARALPHLGAQSYLVFDGARVIDRGVWDAPGRAVPVTRTR